MDARYINPFLGAASNALDIMAGVKIQRGTPFVRDKFQALADMSGIIGFAGDSQGAVILSFPFDLAKLVFQKMTGDQDASDIKAVADAIGELANMIAGGAKAPLSEMGLNIQISIPTVVSGHDHMVSVKSTGPCIVVPFEMEGKTFWVQISMVDSKKG
jgi:chemotaxis protein CheX